MKTELALVGGIAGGVLLGWALKQLNILPNLPLPGSGSAVSRVQMASPVLRTFTQTSGPTFRNFDSYSNAGNQGIGAF